MKESAQAALTVAKGLLNEAFEKWDIHMHVPAGATPKDGPSAGVAMTFALVSLFTGQADPVGRRHDRRDLAARPGHADRRPEGEDRSPRCAPASRP